MVKNYLLDLGFSETESDILDNAFNIKVELSEGEFFVKENQVCNYIAFVVSGMCRHFYLTDKDEITRWIVLPNQFITSLASFITQLPSKETIDVLKKTELLLISKHDWDVLYKEHEFVKKIWLMSIEQNYIGMEDRVFHLIAKSAEERYSWLLENYPQINLQVPDKYIASMLGIHPRHLSRIRGYKK